MDVDEMNKGMADRVAAMNARKATENWSEMRASLEMQAAAFGKNFTTDFLLAHGRDYTIGPDTFAGPRAEAQKCFMNATHLASDNPELTYVEGKVACHGVPIDHAWCVTADGIIVDLTLAPHHTRDTMDHIDGYFGVPFRTAYVRKAVIRNGNYGLLDYFYAKETVPKLRELGLEAGQDWLLDPANVARRRTRRRKG